MRSNDVMIPVDGSPGLPSDLHVAVTVHLPDEIAGPLPVIVAYPGGGYGRRYFDIRTLPGYSQAEYHTQRGTVVVACDHLYVGESAHPDIFALTLENLAAANYLAATAVLAGLRDGTLIDSVEPLETTGVIGIGQSMGGCLLTVQQARHRTFDGAAFLGWSGISTNFPAPGGGRISWPFPERGTDLAPLAATVLGKIGPEPEQSRYCFHWPDEEPMLVDPDIESFRPYTGLVRGDERTPWGSATVPACAITMMTPGAVAAEAAAIDVPVLVACGERDVVPDPTAEPTAYRSSPDVQVEVVPRMGHMHNFAHTREQLWAEVESLARRVTTRAIRLHEESA